MPPIPQIDVPREQTRTFWLTATLAVCGLITIALSVVVYLLLGSVGMAMVLSNPFDHPDLSFINVYFIFGEAVALAPFLAMLFFFRKKDYRAFYRIAAVPIVIAAVILISMLGYKYL